MLTTSAAVQHVKCGHSIQPSMPAGSTKHRPFPTRATASHQVAKCPEEICQTQQMPAFTILAYVVMVCIAYVVMVCIQHHSDLFNRLSAAGFLVNRVSHVCVLEIHCMYIHSYTNTGQYCLSCLFRRSP